jgi:hypothetical protein
VHPHKRLSQAFSVEGIEVGSSQCPRDAARRWSRASRCRCGAELIRYDAMCQAIADAYEVDEVKDIRDKARAFEIYAQQARNVEAERRACEIRLRAERRCGQLLRQMAKAKGAPGNQHRVLLLKGT